MFSFTCGSITTKLGLMVLWHKNLSKLLKVLMTSSSSCSMSFEVEIQDRLSLAEILHIGQLKGADSEFELKIRYKYDLSEKIAICFKNLKILAKRSLKKRCYGNAIGCCRLETIYNDAIYSYTKSHRVSLAYYEPFWHIRQKPIPPPPLPSLNRVKAKFLAQTCISQTNRTKNKRSICQTLG